MVMMMIHGLSNSPGASESVYSWELLPSSSSSSSSTTTANGAAAAPPPRDAPQFGDSLILQSACIL